MTQISVVIPCYNAELLIECAIGSVLKQSFNSYEIIVVDDGSTDRSVEAVRRLSDKIRVLSVENGGPSRARNIGTRAASGRYIQYLDADDWLDPTKLERQYQALESSGADIAYGSWRRCFWEPGGERTFGSIEDKRIQKDCITSLISDFWCAPATYLFRRETVEKAGGWNEKMPMVEDVRVLIDCAMNGAKFFYCSGEPLAYFRVRSGSYSQSNRKIFYRCCLENNLFVEKWFQGHGGLDEIRRNALIYAYETMARGSYEMHKDLFEEAYLALHRLKPGYLPSGPTALRIASSLVGYRNAEAVALKFRRLKALIKK